MDHQCVGSGVNTSDSYPINEPLHIQIISPHEQCRLARRLLETVREVVQTLDVPTTVESVFAFQEFIRFRVFRVPVLVINGKMIATGSLTRKKVENLLKREIRAIGLEEGTN